MIFANLYPQPYRYMTYENSINKSEVPPTIRMDKTIDWLIQSRNEWKQKCVDTKLKLKRQTLETKRLVKEGKNLNPFSKMLTNK